MSVHRPPPQGWLAHYADLIGSWARRKHDTDEGQDAAQNAALSLLQAQDAPLLRDPAAYLRRSVRNGMTARHRDKLAAQSIAWQELPEHEHPTTADVESHTRAAQLSDALQLALEELPLPCQQVFAWHRLEGRTMADIAQRMDLSVSMVEKHMARCMHHLHARLKHHAP
ncbi:sigma-70 family RNA polymerase sigma factor [Achromobacter seleniivolatilans]|uniref:Sigma-70 family RNA polymerase sigma factor n=1 Tax=Achromobacter seleniivolatilans TaxID=3047478 RepID=A0ABY9LTP5_9BURK|nr:sigma-70 family RNA polymerase sigma factor [Achromobacter sp. R39]WMD18131.1 sigma-70 family RNA polymerase sigma factor [Achromobacter sp. R39]